MAAQQTDSETFYAINITDDLTSDIKFNDMHVKKVNHNISIKSKATDLKKNHIRINKFTLYQALFINI